MQQLKEKINFLYKKYENWLPASFFIFGFLFDIFTLGRIDDVFNIISQMFYMAVITFLLMLELLKFDFSALTNKWLLLAAKYRDEVFHFLLGALLSAFTIFYFKSSSLSNSFIFMFCMAILLVMNEFPFFQSLGGIIKSSLFKLCQISFFIYVVPLMIGKVGTLVFLLSLLVSALVTWSLLWYLKKREADSEVLKREFTVPSIIVLVVFLVLYFLKVLPPVPLALQDIGVYHNAEKKYPEYHLYRETSRWFFWRSSDTVFKARPNDKVYAFVRVFSPSGLDDKIYIRWLVYQGGEWKTSDRIPLDVVGGRGEGYRAITYKSNYTPGDWRIVVETENELEIGRLTFEIVSDNTTDERDYHVVVDK